MRNLSGQTTAIHKSHTETELNITAEAPKDPSNIILEESNNENSIGHGIRLQKSFGVRPPSRTPQD